MDSLQDSPVSNRIGWIGIAILLMAVTVHVDDGLIAVAPGVRLFVKQIGRSSPLVIVHGGPGLDMNYLVENLAPFGRTHRLIFYDQRGSGRSTLTTNVTADQHVQDLEMLRRRLRLPQLTLLGHSWGAGLAALYAMAHPDRVDRIILADAIPPRRSGLTGYGAELRSRLTEQERTRVDDADAARRSAKTPEEHVAACRSFWGVFARAYFSDPDAAARDRGDLCASSGEALANGLAVNESVMSRLGDYDWRAAARGFRMPVLVIHGEQDPIRLENAREWAETIPRARLVILPRAGHMSYVEQPAQFFAAVEEFLSEGSHR
jgi:proline iminopeptidase